MKVHISLNVNDINESVKFYSKMLSQEPMKFIVDEEKGKSGYAKFDVANPPLNLVLNEVEYKSGSDLSHMGLQVETTDDVLAFQEKWTEQGLITVDEMGVNCCYAKQDKTWVRDPDGNEWEAFVVLENLDASDEIESCDCSNKVAEYVEAAKGAVASCCGPDPAGLSDSQPKHETCCVANGDDPFHL